MSTPTETTTTVSTQTMLAVHQTAYGSADVLTCVQAPRPVPGRGEVLLQVQAAALDRGTWHLMTGLPRLVRLAIGVRRPRRPVVGRDVAGIIVEVGPEVTGFRVGQQVFGIAPGSFAQFATAKVTKLALAPLRATPAEAATLGISGLTALQALDAARVERGHRVLVIGASGGVGSFAVKLAVARGAVVTAVCSGAKADIVRGWGAERVLDYARDDITAGSEPYDAIIDIAGGTPLRRLRRALTTTGTIVFIGQEGSGTWTGGFGRPMRNVLRMLPARQRYVMLTAREAAPDDLAQLAALVDDGALRPHLHAVYPLVQARAAMTDLVSGDVCGKVALLVERGAGAHASGVSRGASTLDGA